MAAGRAEGVWEEVSSCEVETNGSTRLGLKSSKSGL